MQIDSYEIVFDVECAATQVSLSFGQIQEGGIAFFILRMTRLF